MENLLHDILVSNLTAFLLIFMRFGLALMIMPGIGDSFVSPQIRLLFALALSFVMTPFLTPQLPALPSNTFSLATLLFSEAFIGIFIGTVMRIIMNALDTAGLLISTQAGFSNAMLFNPITATQGSMIGALYSSLGVVLLLMTDMHHHMLAAVATSYQMFPANGHLPDFSSISEAIVRSVSAAFLIGVQIAMPFIIIGTVVQIGFGLLGRLMPQIQIFFLAMPVQILFSLIMLTFVLSTGLVFWLNGFENIVTQSLTR